MNDTSAVTATNRELEQRLARKRERWGIGSDAGTAVGITNDPDRNTVDAASDRDAKGRFRPGNAGGPGRPRLDRTNVKPATQTGDPADLDDLVTAFAEAIRELGAKRFIKNLLNKSPGAAGQLLAVLERVQNATQKHEPVEIIMNGLPLAAALHTRQDAHQDREGCFSRDETSDAVQPTEHAPSDDTADLRRILREPEGPASLSAGTAGADDPGWRTVYDSEDDGRPYDS